LGGLSPRIYHLGNVLLHLLNTFAVFLLARALFTLRREPRAAQMGLVAALFFGVHPLHVESVAWVVGRKDLLYGLFFLGSLVAYCKYLSSKAARYYVLSLAAFTLSLLSKGQAVTLPVILLAIDLVSGRLRGAAGKAGAQAESPALLEKVPFFVLAIIFGIIAISAQQQGQAVGDVTAYPLAQRIAFASYGLVQYVWKLLLPLNLSAFYPYFIRPGEALPVPYWIYPLVVTAAVVILIRVSRQRPWIAFGLAFFLINLLLVLQLLPVGNAIMADRYAYLASFGFFLIVALLHRIWSARVRGVLPTVAIAAVAALLASITFARSQVWHDSNALWSDVIAKHPEAPIAWNNRGIYRKDTGDLAGAISDYSRALELDPRYSLAYTNRAVARQRLGDLEGALQDLDRSIELEANDSAAHVNRGVVRIRLGQPDRALADFTRAIELNPDNAAAYANRGTLRSNSGDYTAALSDLDRALYLNPGQPDALIARALARSGSGDPASALVDLDEALRLRPDNGIAYFVRGNVQVELGRTQLACADFHSAARLGYRPANEKLRIHCSQ
jgi:tetratricopeptide (TPR) repeat protein